jgi:hypothetical protein
MINQSKKSLEQLVVGESEFLAIKQQFVTSHIQTLDNCSVFTAHTTPLYPLACLWMVFFMQFTTAVETKEGCKNIPMCSQ